MGACAACLVSVCVRLINFELQLFVAKRFFFHFIFVVELQKNKKREKKTWPTFQGRCVRGIYGAKLFNV